MKLTKEYFRKLIDEYYVDFLGNDEKDNILRKRMYGHADLLSEFNFEEVLSLSTKPSDEFYSEELRKGVIDAFFYEDKEGNMQLKGEIKDAVLCKYLLPVHIDYLNQQQRQEIINESNNVDPGRRNKHKQDLINSVQEFIKNEGRYYIMRSLASKSDRLMQALYTNEEDKLMVDKKIDDFEKAGTGLRFKIKTVLPTIESLDEIQENQAEIKSLMYCNYLRQQGQGK